MLQDCLQVRCLFSDAILTLLKHSEV